MIFKLDKNNIPHWGRSDKYPLKEEKLQIAAVRYLSYHPRHPMYWATANERKVEAKKDKYGRTYYPAGSKLNRMGRKKGVSDLFIAEPASDASSLFCGLCIELKAKGGSLKKEQIDFLKAMKSRGYFIAVCWNFDAVRFVVDNYLSATFHRITSIKA